MADKPSLPEIVPIFPLTGVLLLPGMRLPLHVFEPRYRNMVADAQASEKMIAMVQPVVPRQDNSPPPDAEADAPRVYPVGCLGAIERCESAPDGRYTLALKGVTRMRLVEELPLHKGYRRVLADYSEFADDIAGQEEEAVDGADLLTALESFGERNSVTFDTTRLQEVPGIALLNGLCMSLPFAPAEKQALLEAPTPRSRSRILLSLMGMNPVGEDVPDPYTPPTLN